MGLLYVYTVTLQCNIHKRELRNACVQLSVTQCRAFANRNVPTSFEATRHVSNKVRTLRLKCNGARAETRFRLSAKRTSPFKSAGVSVQSTTGSRGARISGSNAGYTMFRGSVKSTGYPLHSPVSPSLRLPCVTVCHHISAGLCNRYILRVTVHGVMTNSPVVDLRPLAC